MSPMLKIPVAHIILCARTEQSFNCNWSWLLWPWNWQQESYLSCVFKVHHADSQAAWRRICPDSNTNKENWFGWGRNSNGIRLVQRVWWKGRFSGILAATLSECLRNIYLKNIYVKSGGATTLFFRWGTEILRLRSKASSNSTKQHWLFSAQGHPISSWNPLLHS